MSLTYLAVLDLLLKYGPSAVQIGAKLVAAIKAGKANEVVSDADWVDLDTLSSPENLYLAKGVTLPPPTP